MGGKAKQANRTKNNARPSSSGRSAELIANRDPSLMLVGPGKILPTVFPSLSGGLQEGSMSNDFLLCFKKFHKKDPITKVKALSELKDLVASSTEEEVVNALLSWAHYYPSLTVDIDRKVRESTQVCHGEIVRKCGRQVALHIKRLMPAWLLAQHDDYSVAQYVAEKNLTTTFPNDKLAEAIKFCKKEIYNLLMENLKGNTGYMLSGNKIDDEEEKEAQAARVTGCSLRALEQFIRVLGASPQQADWLWDSLLPLLCANSYWKLAGHSSPFVRCSWYLLTGRVIEQFAERLPRELGRRAANTLLAHPERDPAVLAERWRAVCKLMQSVENWQTYLDNNNLLIKRLFDVLENAAWGEVRPMAALLLPLVSRLPLETRDCDFYIRFFDALLAGLGQKLLVSFKGEREEWSRLIAECLRSVSAWHRESEFVAGLCSRAHRAWLERLLRALLEPESNAQTILIKCTATDMTNLVKHWLKLAEGGDQVFDQVVRNFWLNMSTSMLSQAEKLFEITTETIEVDADPIPILKGHTLFLMTLKTAFDTKAKKKHNIKFADDNNETKDDAETKDGIVTKDDTETKDGAVTKDVTETKDGAVTKDGTETKDGAVTKDGTETKDGAVTKGVTEIKDGAVTKGVTETKDGAVTQDGTETKDDIETKEAPSEGTECDDATSKRFHHNLVEVAELMIAQYFKVAIRTGTISTVLPHIMQLVREFQSEHMFQTLAKELVEGEVTLFNLYERELKELMRLGSRCEELVEVVFIMLQYLDEQEQNAVFDSFTKMPGEVVEWCLERALATSRSVAAARRWLRGAAAGAAVRALFSRENDPAAQQLLLDAFDYHDDGELLISSAMVDELITSHTKKILSIVEHLEELQALGAARREGGPCEGALLELRARRAAALLHALRPPLPAACRALLTALFHLTLRVPCGATPQLSEETWEEAAVAWRRGAAALSPDDHEEFMREAIAAVHVHLFRNKKKLDMESVQLVARMSPLLALPNDFAPPPEDFTMLEDVSRRVLNFPMPGDVPVTPLDELALRQLAVWGEASCPLREECSLAWSVEAERGLRADAVLVHAACTLFRAMYVRAILLRKMYSADRVATGETWCGAALRRRYFRDQFFAILYDCAVLAVLDQYYAFWESYELVNSLRVRLHELVREMVPAIPPELLTHPTDTELMHAAQLKYLRDFHRAALHNEWGYKRLIDEAEKVMEQRRRDHIRDGDEQPPACPEPLMLTLKARAAKYGYFWTRAFKYFLEVRDQLESEGMPPPPPRSPDLDISGYVVVDDADNPIPSMSAALIKVGSPEIKLLTSAELQWVFCAFEFRDSNSRHDEVRSSLVPAARDVRGEQVVGTTFVHDLQVLADIVKKREKRKGNGKKIAEYNEDLPYVSKSVAMIRNYYYVCKCDADKAQALLRDFMGNVTCGLDAVINGYYRFNEAYLYDTLDEKVSRLRRSYCASVMDLLAELVRSRGWSAPARHWDFANIALCAVLSALAKAKAKVWRTAALATVARPALALYCAVRRFIAAVPARAQRELPSAHVAALPREWTDIFAPDLSRSLHVIICAVLEEHKSGISDVEAPILESLIEAAEWLDPRATPHVLRSGAVTLQRGVRAATAALAAVTHRAYKYLAYALLRNLAPALVDADVETLTNRPPASAEGEEKSLRLTLDLYEEPLHNLQALVDATLSNYEVCTDVCEVAPWMDSHSIVLGYVLLTLAVHHQCELATGDLAQQYVNIFNKQEYAEGALATAVRLLPARAAQYMHSAAPAAAFPRDLLPAFARPPKFSILEPANSSEIGELACLVLRAVLGGPGAAAARGYWGALPAPRSHALQRLLPPAVAPALVAVQMRRAQQAAARRTLGHDVTITCNAAEMWVSCSLEVDDRELTMRVSYSELHPLHAPRVTCSSIDPHCISVYLGYKNGDIVEAMCMWKAGVGRSLEGAKTCCVCYCRLHPEDGSTPSVPCRQCRNDFHSQCLRRWFRTSHRSNCPVCRTNF